MRPVDWKELRAVCESEGCVFDRQKGDHYIMTKAGLARPVVIPRKKGLKEDIVLSVARTLGLTREALLARLDKSKGK
jgi:predicted RNA binding protein YcfA (HicA-like mRNA interferase family)